MGVLIRSIAYQLNNLISIR